MRVRMARLQEVGDEMKFLVKLEKQRMLIVGPTQYASEFLKNAEKILGLKMAVVPPGGKPRPIEGAAGPISSPRKQWGCVYRATSGKLSVYVWKCDITIMHVDVIVNAANERLDHGGGWSSFSFNLLHVTRHKRGNSVVQSKTKQNFILDFCQSLEETVFSGLRSECDKAILIFIIRFAS